MIPDWHTTHAYFSGLLPDRHPALWERLTAVLRSADLQFGLLNGTRDIWARDYCPLQVSGRRFIKFRYRPDYLRGRYADLITGDEVCGQLAGLGEIYHSDIFADGGNVVASATTVVVTDKIFRENPRREPNELRSALARRLEVEHCIIIPTEPGDAIGHSDGVVRFLDDTVVVVNDYATLAPGYGKRLRGILAAQGLSVEPIPYFCEDRIIAGISSAVGNYINFLRVGDLILLPVYGHRKDDQVCRTLERLCPKATICPLECRSLAREGGVLNCVSWTVSVMDETRNPSKAAK